MVHPRTSALRETTPAPVDSENLTNTPRYLGNGTRYDSIIHQKSLESHTHTGFRLVPRVVTLNDLEPRNSQLCHFTHSAVTFGANYFELIDTKM